MPTYLASTDRTMPSTDTSSRTSPESLPLSNGHDLSPTDGTLPFHPRKGVHSLPHEVMSRIFLLGANANYPYTDSPFLITPEGRAPVPDSDFQILVTHVCHRWRRIALETPALWNILHFRARGDVERGEEFIARCAARSSSYPVDIFIETVADHEYNPPSNIFTTEMDTIFTYLVDHMSMWRSLHLKVRCNNCKLIARKFLSTCKGAPILETLQLYHFEDFTTPSDLHLATHRRPVVCFDNDLPSLKNVSMIGVNLPWDVSPYVTKLRYLELALHRDFTRPAYKDWRMMVYESPELQSLSIIHSGPMPKGQELDAPTTDDQPKPPPRNIWPAAGDRFPIESLQHLTLGNLDSPEYLCDFISHLIFPSLTRLTLLMAEDDYTPFFKLVAGTNPLGTTVESAYRLRSPLPSLETLQELNLMSLQCDKATFRAFLLRLEGLRTLEVVFSDEVPDWLLDLLMEGVSIQVPLQEEDENRTRGGRALALVNYVSKSTGCGGGGSNAARGTGLSTADNVNGTPMTMRRVPLLPRLQTFKTSGLTGRPLNSFIRYREQAGLRIPNHRDKEDDVHRRSTYRVKHLIIGWTEARNGEDVILDEIVKNGLPDITVETYDDSSEDDEEGEEEDYEEEGQEYEENEQNDEDDDEEDEEDYAEDDEGDGAPDDTESSVST